MEIDAGAIRRNVRTFRSLVARRAKLWAVVKSNAYGHGLYTFSPIASRAGVDGFCIDSLVEGQALRRAGVKKPMLVLGATLPSLLTDAMNDNIAVSVSNFPMLKAVAHLPHPPKFHLKFDTGMHRQGFSPVELERVVRTIKSARPRVSEQFEGVFTHFAAAKDLNYPTYTDMQFSAFLRITERLRNAGFTRLIRHAAATGGTLIGRKYHADAVRVGIGLYGLWPSRELEAQLGSRVHLAPVLSWRTVVVEVKALAPGDYVGYDLTERMHHRTIAAIIPIGYWHGFPRALSSIGEVLIRGRRAKVLGRVSMDMVVVDATEARPAVGDVVTVIGSDRRDELHAADVAAASGTVNYETVTRLNPLMERVVVGR